LGSASLRAAPLVWLLEQAQCQIALREIACGSRLRCRVSGKRCRALPLRRQAQVRAMFQARFCKRFESCMFRTR
jgi:hypothetical protein